MRQASKRSSEPRYDGGRLLSRISELEALNRNLYVKLAQLRRSRDRWKKRALDSSLEKERRRKSVARWRKDSRSYSVEQWRQHELIVARIRAIPDRQA